jgi:hypothetical protein
MDETPEIRERLDRISALSAAGAAKPELLREVRSLLEEGERSLRAVEPDSGGVFESSRGSAGPGGEPSEPREEADVA